MGSGSLMMVLAEEQRADKGKLLAYKSERQRAFDEEEARMEKRGKGLVDEEAPQGNSRVVGLDLSWVQLISHSGRLYCGGHSHLPHFHFSNLLRGLATFGAGSKTPGSKLSSMDIPQKCTTRGVLLSKKYRNFRAGACGTLTITFIISMFLTFAQDKDPFWTMHFRARATYPPKCPIWGVVLTKSTGTLGVGPFGDDDSSYWLVKATHFISATKIFSHKLTHPLSLNTSKWIYRGKQMDQHWSPGMDESWAYCSIVMPKITSKNSRRFPIRQWNNLSNLCSY